GGAWSRLGILRGGKVIVPEANKGEFDDLGGRNWLDLKVANGRAVLVGQGGLLMFSSNPTAAACHLDYAELKLPDEVRANWDFHAVHCAGSHIWVVGRPGSVVLHSPNRGVTWEVQRTGQPLPLHGVHFADANHGWAVGELGAILGTTDGGKTWQVQ